MNRILFEPNECGPTGGRVALGPADRRTRHIRQVLHAKTGDILRVGRINGLAGSATLLSDDADQDAVVALQRKVQGWDNIESVTYKSKDEALEEYKNTMSNRNAADAVAALDGENPIPASLVIKLTDPQLVSDTANKLIRDSDFISVADGDPASAVQYGRETVEKLFSFTNYLRIGALVLVGLLTFVAFVFINNTIRLAITARRREISIMRLVGASNGFIRGPFLMEGAIHAIIGAALAIVSIELIRNLALPRLQASLAFLPIGIDGNTFLLIYLILLAAGLVIGLIGSAFAMRRYLKV